MPADVRDIPGLREWLAALAKYRAEAGEALAGIELELRRAFDWVEAQQHQWRTAVRDCEEAVVQAKAELAARRFPGFDGRMPDTTVQERNLRRAEDRLEYARDKVTACRAWAGRLPKMIEEAYSGPSRRLSLFLEGELAKATAGLDRQIEALESYAALRPDFAPAASTFLPPPGG